MIIREEEEDRRDIQRKYIFMKREVMVTVITNTEVIEEDINIKIPQKVYAFWGILF
jgi:uncharacterized protein YnzC (UPF0291/DUF896 family)